MWGIILGAFLMLAGIFVMARRTLIYRQLSTGPNRWMHTGDSLEPPRQGLRFLGARQHWVGIVMMAIGALLIFLSTIV